MLSRRNFLRSSVTAAAAAPFSPALFALEPAKATAPGGPVNLSSNENAYGPLPSAQREMVNAIALANRYPDWQYDELWEELGKLHNVKPEEVTLGCGSGDLLRMVAESLCMRTKVMVQAAPTFEALAMYHKRSGGKVVAVPLRADHAHDLDGMLAKAKEGADLVYICNPNNPTASLTPREELEAFIAKLPRETYVLIDEAYHHFAVSAPGYTSFLDKPIGDSRVFVLRTFSKIFGLAGMRVGYAVGPAELIERIATYHVFDNPNVIGVRAAIASLRDNSGRDMMLQKIVADRDEFLHQAGNRKLKVIPSSANFVMFETRRPVRQVIDHFKQNHVLIGRPFPPYDKYARISLGTPPEMQTFWKVWDQLPAVQ